MRTVLQVLIIGIQNGAILSLVGLGLALVYKGPAHPQLRPGRDGNAPRPLLFISRDEPGFVVAGELTVSKGKLWLGTLVAIVLGALLGHPG